MEKSEAAEYLLEITDNETRNCKLSEDVSMLINNVREKILASIIEEESGFSRSALIWRRKINTIHDLQFLIEAVDEAMRSTQEKDKGQEAALELIRIRTAILNVAGENLVDIAEIIRNQGKLIKLLELEPPPIAYAESIIKGNQILQSDGQARKEYWMNLLEENKGRLATATVSTLVFAASIMLFVNHCNQPNVSYFPKIPTKEVLKDILMAVVVAVGFLGGGGMTVAALQLINENRHHEKVELGRIAIIGEELDGEINTFNSALGGIIQSLDMDSLVEILSLHKELEGRIEAVRNSEQLGEKGIQEPIQQ